MVQKVQQLNDVRNSNGSSINQYIAVIICSSLATLYGQTVGWSSAAMTQLQKGGSSLPSGEDGIDPNSSGWLGGAFCLGALISAPIHGLLADAKGRKFAAYLIALCFMIHWLFICFAPNMTYVFIGRAFGGAGGAGSITISSIYSNEVAESRIRGRLGGFLALLYVIGIFWAFIVGAYASFYVAVYIYLAMSFLFILLWWSMPESPSYLILQQRESEAKCALKWLRKCGDSHAEVFLEELKLQQAGAAKTATVLEFLRHPASRRGMFIGCVLSSMQTYSGIFAIHNYAATIFERAGGILDPFTSSIVYGGLMCIGAIMPPLFVDRTGRKTLLAWSCAFQSISLAVLGLYFWGLSVGYLDIETEYDPAKGRTTFELFVALLPVVTLSFSVFIYYIGLGSVTYIVSAELFLDEMRGVGGAAIAITIWITSFTLLQFFSPAVALFGDHIVFLFFSAVCVFCSIFTVLFLPETRGRTPQQIAALLIKK